MEISLQIEAVTELMEEHYKYPMKRYVYTVYELLPDQDGTLKRRIWAFDNRMAAQGLIDYLNWEDINFPCLEIIEEEIKY